MNTDVVVATPEIPSKWDIIPIHSSDVATYKSCRRKWDWSSPARRNLRRKVAIYGVNLDLWFGTGIHYALENMYDPILPHDPVESFLTWYDIQLNGGIVGPEWLDRVNDLNPVDQEDGTYKIVGLKYLLPQYIDEDFEALRELGVGMMSFYRDYAKKNDNFVVVARESTYSIPLGFESVDLREESPNYGSMLEVHARGKRDVVIYYPDSGKYGLRDYKTAARVDEDYFLKYEKDEQFSNYLWATNMEAELYPDYPWHGKFVGSIDCIALRKNYPKPPTVLQSGWLSLDKQKEGTTADLFMKEIRQSPLLQEWYNDNAKAQAYYEYLCERGDEMFVERFPVTRNKYELVATGNHLRMIAQEMLNDDTNIYPNPTGSWGCLRCTFRPACIAADDGSDWMGMLNDGYEVNHDR